MDTVLKVADSVARLDHGHIVESGSLVDLLSTPSSSLGRALQPRRGHDTPPRETTTWFVTYGANPVPTDWVTRLASELGTSVDLLGASIQSLNGATVGNATIAVGEVDPRRIAAALAGLGLHAELDAVAKQLEDVA